MCQIATNSHIPVKLGDVSSQITGRRLYKIGWAGLGWGGEGEEGEGKKLRSHGLHTNHNFGSMQAWTHFSLNNPFFRETILHHWVPDKGPNSLITGHFGWSIHVTTRSPFVHFVQPLFNYMLRPVFHIISNRIRHFKSWREFIIVMSIYTAGAMNSDKERKDVTPLFCTLQRNWHDFFWWWQPSTFLHRAIYFVCLVLALQQTTDTALSKNLKRRPPTEQRPS